MRADKLHAVEVANRSGLGNPRLAILRSLLYCSARLLVLWCYALVCMSRHSWGSAAYRDRTVPDGRDRVL